MESGLFVWLEGISPLWWVALGIALGALEMLVFSFFLIWPALGALVMAVLLWIIPGIPGDLQVALFAILSVALTFGGRRMFQQNDEPETTLNQRGKQIVGKKARVLEFDLGEGTVEVDGLRWSATWPEGQTAAPGDTVRITANKGMDVEVENL